MMMRSDSVTTDETTETDETDARASDGDTTTMETDTDTNTAQEQTAASNAATRANESTSTADDSPEAVELTRKPALLSSGVAVAAAIAATLAAGTGSLTGLAFGAVGTATLALGLVVGHRSAVDVGALVVFFGIVAGGLDAVAVGPTIVGTITVVLAWDVGHTAIDIGEQLGRDARTVRLEAVTVGSSLLVGLLSGTIGYAVYVLGAGGQPVAALVLLLLAAALITVGLGRRRSSNARAGRRIERSRRS